MIRNETFRNSVCIEATVIDLDGGTITREENGQVVWSRALTADERVEYTPPVDVRAELLARLNDSPLTLDDIKAVVADAINQGVL